MRKFKKIYIEITNVCNFACSFCPQTGRRPEFMKFETFNKILEQIAGYSDYIYFHVKGEPLLHPEMDRFLDLSHEKGFKVTITTNGALIDGVKEKLMNKPALRQINISLHSLDVNRQALKDNNYLNNIISFTHEALERTEMIVALRLWNLSEDNSVNIKANKNRHILEIIEKEFILPYRIDEKLTNERGIKIRDRLFLNQDHEFQWPDLRADMAGDSGFCYGLRNQAAILVDGTVVPCCLDGEGVINLGNINTVPFSEIIQNDRAHRILDGFSRRQAVEELCRRCGYRKRFDKNNR